MPDYSKGKIYKLVSNYTDDIYIGSTCQSLSMRKGGHKYDYKIYLSGKRKTYISSFKLFEKGNVDVVLIEECSVHNKDELHRRERYFIEKLECVNKCIPGRTHKEWYENNKEKRQQKQREYYEINKDKISQHDKQYYKDNKEKKIHQAKQYYIDNKDNIKQQMKQYRENNKDKLKEYRKEHYEMNKDKVKKYYEEYYIVNKDKLNQQKKQYREKKKLANP